MRTYTPPCRLQCCYNLLSLFSTAAFICGLYSYSVCNFASRYVTLADNASAEEACANAGFTPPFDQLCENFSGTHGVGFEGWWIGSDNICYEYTQLTPSGYQTPPLDTKFNSARALSITASVVGGAAWFTLMLASCCKLDQYKLRGIACYFLLATLFQGLSLLIFRSNVCNDPGFFGVYLTGTNDNANAENFVSNVSCGLSTGSKLAISATVLYFVCNSIVPLVVVPAPLWGGTEPQAVPSGPPEFAEEANA